MCNVNRDRDSMFCPKWKQKCDSQTASEYWASWQILHYVCNILKKSQYVRFHSGPACENIVRWNEAKTKQWETQPAKLLIQKHLPSYFMLSWRISIFSNMIWNILAIHWCNFFYKTKEYSSSNKTNHPRSCLVNFHTRRKEFFQVVCKFRPPDATFSWEQDFWKPKIFWWYQNSPISVIGTVF